MNRADDLYSSIRSVDSIGTRSLAGGIAPHMSGVGIFFQQESDGKVYVNTIVSGGSAERDGRVRVGDVMCSVDGRDVIGEPVSVLRSLLLGHEGSNVVLTFARAVEPGEADHEGGTVIAKFDVELPRGSPEYFARVDATRRYEAEMQDLRYQLKTTLGEEKEVAEEVERVKRVLQLERGASARREKVPVPLRAPAAAGVWGAHAAPCTHAHDPYLVQEMDEIRATHMREVASLTEACRRAETARREAMGRLEPVKSRADDMTGARRFLQRCCIYFESETILKIVSFVRRLQLLLKTCSSSCCFPLAAFRRYASHSGRAGLRTRALFYAPTTLLCLHVNLQRSWRE